MMKRTIFYCGMPLARITSSKRRGGLLQENVTRRVRSAPSHRHRITDSTKGSSTLSERHNNYTNDFRRQKNQSR
ncbi:unnamed protein product [Trichogramma brassicae]|uniref:Uncharacterized protein n=1 Tax=Trichogramma brassicae TaxID=86971 RepID=A0A6H5I3M4_9HYME|nr:unnamed protein product [Trichogramma brassicae]